MICEVCGKQLKRRERITGAYRAWVCERCELEFFVLRGEKDFSCPEFMICAIAGNLHCQDCTHSAVNHG
jgi:hypothetical protein